MWIISLHVSSPGIWHMDDNDGMEQGSHREYVIREKLPQGPEMYGTSSGGFSHCLNHIPGMVSDLRNPGYKYPSSCTKNRDSFEAKESTGKKYWPLLTSICVFQYLCFSGHAFRKPATLGIFDRIFRKKIERRKDSLLGKALYASMVKTTCQHFLDAFTNLQVHLLWKQSTKITCHVNVVKMLGFRSV